ncbi:MAG: L-seryl-tRNA(Sec) selenium transferase [Acidimicrobiia bacterium]|nr:L-seryl-tRNA(Sec) selenium transferase [Acidimicrobiia bacterium]MDH5237466.1 L-seryl-tRNA(Sec) selenium transferase [Acidimicrobiia bacterium]
MERPPSVDKLARSLADTGLPHPMLVDAARAAIADGDHTMARHHAEQTARRLLQPVVNATGVLLHTNLGRAPWPAHDAGRYRNLELDLTTGERGSRQSHAPALLARACGAEAAMVVNNCASAVLLILAALARDQGVAVSRSELVEIGGGFRVPDVMEQSGARLVEVGTTNRTRRADFERAVEADGVTLVMQIHQSNYRIVGFTESVTTAELADLGPPLVADIGSGLLDAACPWMPDGPPAWLEGEPAARQTLEAGAELVAFSGDKLLGGPQAGIIAGNADLVRRCGRHPLARALRPGGLVLGALQDLALTYLRRDGMAIPFWRMASLPIDGLQARARALGRGEVVATVATPGGGTLPGVEIPSVGVALDGDHRERLRAAHPPIMARVVEDRTVLDLRTIDPDEDAHVAAVLGSLEDPA